MRRGAVLAAASGETQNADAVAELTVSCSQHGARQTLVLFRNGVAVGDTAAGELHYANPSAGTYRVEVWRPVPNLVYGDHVVPVAYSGRLRLVPSLPTPTRPGLLTP